MIYSVNIRKYFYFWILKGKISLTRLVGRLLAEGLVQHTPMSIGWLTCFSAKIVDCLKHLKAYLKVCKLQNYNKSTLRTSKQFIK